MNEVSRTLDDIADDVRSHLSGAVENIIKAGQALQEGRNLHPSDNAFHVWCKEEFPDLKHGTRNNIMQVAKRFGGSQYINCHPITVLYELAAPSVPNELVEDFMSSKEPVKIKDVKQAKEGYKQLREDPDFGDVVEDLETGRKTPREAAQEAYQRTEAKRKEMENSPNVFDLKSHIKSTDNCSIDVSAVNLVVAMEQLISKFDRRDVIMYIHSAIQDDVVNIKVPALHEMADILTELCEDFPLNGTTNKNVN